MTEETKIIYYKDEDKVPYMIKLSIAPDKATLKDFKNALNINAKCLKFFFQTIVDDFGVVKEEISDDDMKLPFVNGRAVCWLIQIEGSLAGSDSRSQSSLIMNEYAKDNCQEIANNYQFTSMQSVSSNGSSISNNENIERNNYRKSTNSGQIYDTLNNRKASKLRQMTPLKDMNTDDTTTETESIISGIDDMRLHHLQRPSSAQGNLNSNGSIRRGLSSKPQFGSFNNHNQLNKKPNKQKLSLDSHYNNQQNGFNRQQSSNYSNYPPNFNQMIKHKRTSHSGKDITDSFSEDSDEADLEDNRFKKQSAPSVISSELDTTTFFDTENDDDGSSIFTEQTNSTMSSRQYGHNRNRRRIRHKLQHSHFKANSSLHSSVSSLTDSTMSLNIITVTLNMDSVNFLGISIVGQSNKGGEGGIYVGSIMSGGAVALDGRIEPGDMILQVNEVSFENMSNDDAVRVLREAVMKPGPVKLVVAKCWDPNPQGYFTVSKQEPIRPIDPSAWVAHTQAHTGIYPIGSNTNTFRQQQQQQNFNQQKVHQYRLTHSVSTLGSNSSLTTSIADTTVSTTYNNAVGANNYKQYNYGNNLGTTTTTNADSTRFGNEHLNLTIKTDMETLVRAMAAPDSGLEVRDRNWLKITIPNAFIGSEVVDWLFNHVEGFPDRRDARKYACDMLKYGFIRHAVNKVRFSEQCYYIFGDFNQSTLNSQMMTMNGGAGNLFTLNEENELDFDSVSELDRDTMYAPMNFPPPPPGAFNNYQHHPRLYSNMNGIGGPPPPPSYLSSSSSNATSNSNSTASNNTTTQTIATTTTAMGYGGAGSSSSGVGGSSMTSSNSNTTANTTSQSGFSGGIINSDRTNACQFYYPPPSLQMTALSNNNTMSSLSSSIFQSNKQSMISCQNDSQNESVNHTTQQSQYTFDTQNRTDLTQSQISNYNYSTQLTTPFNNYVSKAENRSVKSDNSSSGNGSDVELLSSKKGKQRKDVKQQQNIYYNQIQQSSTNYYEIAQFNTTSQTNGNNTLESNSFNSTGSQKQRTLDQVPRELRVSKQSFHQAMGNPCEFFVDVM